MLWGCFSSTGAGFLSGGEVSIKKFKNQDIFQTKPPGVCQEAGDREHVYIFLGFFFFVHRSLHLSVNSSCSRDSLGHDGLSMEQQRRAEVLDFPGEIRELVRAESEGSGERK